MPAPSAQTDVLVASSSPLPQAISLDFDGSVPAPIRCRMTYAFRVFAAIYGHAVVDARNCASECRFIYGGRRDPSALLDAIYIPALYRTRVLPNRAVNAAPVIQPFAGESFPLFFGTDPVTCNPDWLGEIFLWLSGELELGTTHRDSVGRIPFSETPFSRHKLSPRRPYAARLMAWLENSLRRNAFPSLPKAPSPILGCQHIVLPSHDIDFHYNGRRSALLRLSKNLAIAAHLYKSSSFFFENLAQIRGLLSGARPGDYLLPLLDAAQSSGYQSTFFPVARRAHRRDPNYSLETIALPISKAQSRGFSLGLHGSYQSVMEDRSLASEVAILGERFGKWPRANRQHWLRFESQRTLFREVESAGMIADSSSGFPETVGFRNAASFAFPPYDFERESPHRFLEIPLVLMDGGLESEARNSAESPQQIAQEVLEESRNSGWGGVSILWHNPLEPLSVPREVNEVFWRCAAKRAYSQESWLTFDQFLAAVLSRYQQAGLLEGISVNA